MSDKTVQNGDTFFLTKDMAGTIIYAKLSLADAITREEVGRVGEEENARVDVKHHSGKIGLRPEDQAVEYVEGKLRRYRDRLFEEKNVAIANSVVVTSPKAEVVGIDDFVNQVVNGESIYVSRLYTGRKVTVTVKPDGELITMSGSERIGLPNRIRSGLHKSNEDRVYTLQGVLSWVTPNDTDHETKMQADYHGGSKPNFILYDLVDEDTPPQERLTRLHDMCIKYRWLHGPKNKTSSLYAPKTWFALPADDINSVLDPANKFRWTGLRYVTADGTEVRTLLNSAEYFVAAGIHRETATIPLIRFGKTGGLFPQGVAHIPKSLRDLMFDLCLVNNAYSDDKNPTHHPSRDFDVDYTFEWMHPKDFLTVSVDRGVLVSVDPERDVQLCETSE